MPHKSPFTDWIAEEWSALTWQEVPMSAEERLARATALYDSCREARLWKADIRDAALGMYPLALIAMQEARYADVVELLEEYLRHPSSGSPDDDYYDYSHVRLGSANILAGNVDKGIAWLRTELNAGHFPEVTRKHLVRNDLVHTLNDLGPEGPIDRRIAAFIAELLRGWKGHTRKAKQALDARSNADLLTLLEATYKKSASKAP